MLKQSLVKNIKKHNSEWSNNIIKLLECKIPSMDTGDLNDYEFCIVGEVRHCVNYYTHNDWFNTPSGVVEKRKNQNYCKKCKSFANKFYILDNKIRIFGKEGSNPDDEKLKIHKKYLADELEAFYKHADMTH